MTQYLCQKPFERRTVSCVEHVYLAHCGDSTDILEPPMLETQGDAASQMQHADALLSCN